MGYEVVAQAFVDAIIEEYDTQFAGVRATLGGEDGNTSGRSVPLERGP